MRPFGGAASASRMKASKSHFERSQRAAENVCAVVGLGFSYATPRQGRGYHKQSGRHAGIAAKAGENPVQTHSGLLPASPAGTSQGKVVEKSSV